MWLVTDDARIVHVWELAQGLTRCTSYDASGILRILPFKKIVPLFTSATKSTPGALPRDA